MIKLKKSGILKVFVFCLLVCGLPLLMGCNYTNPMSYFKSVDEAQLESTEEILDSQDESTVDSQEQSETTTSNIINTSQSETTQDNNTTLDQTKDNNIVTVYSIGKATQAGNTSVTLDEVSYSLNYDTYELNVAGDIETKDLIKIYSDINEVVSSNEYIIIVTDKESSEEISYFLGITLASDNKIGVIGCDIKDDAYEISDDDIISSIESLKSSTISSNVLVCDLGSEFENAVISDITNDEKISLDGVNDLDYVTIVYDYLGNDGDLLERALASSDGVILVTTNSSGELTSIVNDMVNDNSLGVPIVIVSFANTDNISNYHTPTQARILLALTLAKGESMSEIAASFAIY